MDHELTIDSEDAYALATELSKLTGTTVSEVVMVALREKIERERRAHDVAARIHDARQLVEELQHHLTAPVSSQDTDSLYGEDGLPV